MSPNLTELAESPGFTAVLLPFVLAGLVSTQSVAQWFDERNP